MNVQQVHTMPGTVRAARVLMCVQVLMEVVLSALVLLPLALNGFLVLNFVLGVAVAVLAGAMVVLMRTRRRWVQWVGLAIEGLLAANALVGLMGTGSVGAVAGLALAVGVIALLLTPSSNGWFTA
ncbi:hypothetical protein ABZW11_21375 [Nonomuraea sp. NPDC004580]|uniref:hypothetical protein n=1 Tax=Nonomuraea sp. NPDC004580 TaxID=3154552 RepID=UPI0033AF27CD